MVEHAPSTLPGWRSAKQAGGPGGEHDGNGALRSAARLGAWG
jgi:hypothetical protein